MKKHFLALCLFLLVLCLLALGRVFSPKVANASDFLQCKILYATGLANTPESFQSAPPSETFHSRSVDPVTPVADLMKEEGPAAGQSVNLAVDLSSRTLLFKIGQKVLKQYRIAAGSKTVLGDKEREGDRRTPRGEFFICSKEVYAPPKPYLGSRWMLLSYPGLESAQKGLDSHRIDTAVFSRIKKALESGNTPPQDTPLGSAVGIHGGAKPSYPKDWTAGCVGMFDQDVEEIYAYVRVGTRVVIK